MLSTHTKLVVLFGFIAALSPLTISAPHSGDALSVSAVLANDDGGGNLENFWRERRVKAGNPHGKQVRFLPRGGRRIRSSAYEVKDAIEFAYGKLGGYVVCAGRARRWICTRGNSSMK